MVQNINNDLLLETLSKRKAASRTSSKVVHLYLDLLYDCMSGMFVNEVNDGSAARDAAKRLTAGQVEPPVEDSASEWTGLVIETMAEYELQSNNGHFFAILLKQDLSDSTKRRITVCRCNLFLRNVTFMEKTFRIIHF